MVLVVFKKSLRVRLRCCSRRRGLRVLMSRVIVVRRVRRRSCLRRIRRRRRRRRYLFCRRRSVGKIVVRSWIV